VTTVNWKHAVALLAASFSVGAVLGGAFRYVVLGCASFLFTAGAVIKAQADTITVDNLDSGFSVVSGTWTTFSSAGEFGTNYRFHNAGTGSSVVDFTPTIVTAGLYDVYVWVDAAANRATNAPFTVSYNGGLPNYQRE
jgi:hypothetical protein